MLKSLLLFCENQRGAPLLTLFIEFFIIIMNGFIKERKYVFMPKIIENVREKLLAEARRQITEGGYSSVTIRSIAGACGLGVGTVYNYFKSKDMLIATFMLEDWQKAMSRIYECCEKVTEPEGVLYCIYDQLTAYMQAHSTLFADPQAMKVFSEASTQRHKQLRNQLAKPIRSLKVVQQAVNGEFLAEFIAEALLTWTVAGKSYEEIAGILRTLLI